jgi:hypothetical protein
MLAWVRKEEEEANSLVTKEYDQAAFTQMRGGIEKGMNTCNGHRFRAVFGERGYKRNDGNLS